MANTLMVIADDFDPFVSYHGSHWHTDGNPQNEWNATVHGTVGVGDGFTFAFWGTSISVFGTLTQGVKTPIVSSYSLDGGSKLLYSAPPNQTDVTYHNAFYNSPSVPLGIHSLAVQLEDVGAGGIFWLDYMTYTIPRADDTLPSTSAVIPETSHTSANSSATNSVTGNDIAIGVLVPAIIVPICVTLMLMLLGVWWIVKRRRADWHRVVSELTSPRSEHRASQGYGNTTSHYSAQGGSRGVRRRSSPSGDRQSGRASGDRTWTSDWLAGTQSVGTFCEPPTSVQAGPSTPPTIPLRAYAGGFGGDRYLRTDTGQPTRTRTKADIPPAYASTF